MIARGEITGRDQALYNVWIVPGYEGPLRRAGDAWHHAGTALHKYREDALYDEMHDIARKSFRFARKDMLHDFAFDGTARTWREAMATAHERSDKRVFGWWFAYPWALLEGTGNTLVRIGLVAPASFVVAGVGTTIAPAAYWLYPAGESAFYATVPGAVIPALTISWDAIVAPPLALLGQQPTPERADGFWLKRVDPLSSDAKLKAAYDAFDRWQQHMLTQPELSALNNSLITFRKEQDKKRETFLAQQAKATADYETDIARKRFAALQQLATREGLLPPEVNRAQLFLLVERYGKAPFLQALQKGMTAEEAQWYLQALLDNMKTAQKIAPALRADDEKTDPVRRNIELLGK